MSSPEDQAQENLKAFVDKGKSIAKAKGIDWDSNAWAFGGDQADLRRHSIHFRGLPSSKKKRDGVIFQEPFNTFAKATISILCAAHDFKFGTLDNYVNILRYIYAIESDPARFNDLTFQAALDLIFSRNNLAIRSRGPRASNMNLMADLVDSFHLSIEPISWKHGIANPSPHRNPDDPESEAEHNAKLPSDEVIAAVVELYHQIPKTDVRDRLLICLSILLLITGFRIKEALTLPWDCLENHIPDRADGKGPLLGEDGMPVVYSRIRQYLPEKKGEKVTASRYLGRIGSQILRAVFEEIQGITQPSHKIALWMAKNPGRAWLPFPPQNRWITHEEVDRLFSKSAMSSFYKNNSLKSEIRENWPEAMFPRSELDRVIVSASKIGVVRNKPWPIHSHEILFLVGGTTFGRPTGGRGTNKGIPNSVRPLGPAIFSTWLVGGKASRFRSVFERYGKLDAQGNPLRLTSHQFRHWLNNEMYLGGMSEVQIRYQFGRFNQRSNSTYDHRDPIERAMALRDAARKGEILGGLGAALRRMKVVDREEWIKSAYGNVHWGPLGGCADETIRRADAMPKECANCGGLIVVKGDPEGREEAVRQLEFVEWWLAKAEEDVQDGDLDNDLQVRYYRYKAASLHRIIATHDDPSIRVGTHVLMDFISGSAELLDGACHV